MAIFILSSILKKLERSLKALFGQNIKKLKILKLSPDSRYLQKLALNCKNEGKGVCEPRGLLTPPLQYTRNLFIQFQRWRDDFKRESLHGKKCIVILIIYRLLHPK